MTREIVTVASDARPPREPRHFFRVVFAMIGLLVAAAALTLRTVLQPGELQIKSSNPTPFGYTWSLLLFVLPMEGV